MIRDGLGASLYYLLPLIAGYGLLPHRLCRSLATAWAAGSMGLLALVGLVNLSANSVPESWRHAIFALAIGLLGVRALRFFPRIVGGLRPPPIAYPLVLVVAIAAQALYRVDSPYPSFMNWDALGHLTLARQLDRGFFFFDLTRYSDTFRLGTYFPIYHTTLLLSWTGSGAHPEGLYWFLDLFHGLVTPLVAGYLGHSVRGRSSDAFLAGTLAALTLESQIAMAGFSHMPQTITGAVFALCVAERISGQSRVSRSALAIQLIYLVLAHFFVGVTAAILLVSLYALTSPRKTAISSRLLNLAILVITAATILLATRSSWFRINPFSIEDSVVFNLSADQKNDLFRHWYGYGYYIYPVVAAAFAWATRDKRVKALCVVGGALIPVVLFPFPYTFKFFALAHFIFPAFVASALSWAFVDGQRLWARLTTMTLFSACWFMVFAINEQLSLKRWLRFDGVFTNVSENELEAARFLEAPRYRGTLLVSEPATQYILEGLAGINSAGGTWANRDTRERLSSITEAASPETIQAAVFAVKDGVTPNLEPFRVLAIGARFRNWRLLPLEQRLASYVNVWTPQHSAEGDGRWAATLASSPGFKLVFRNSDIALLEVTRPAI